MTANVALFAATVRAGIRFEDHRSGRTLTVTRALSLTPGVVTILADDESGTPRALELTSDAVIFPVA